MRQDSRKFDPTTIHACKIGWNIFQWFFVCQYVLGNFMVAKHFRCTIFGFDGLIFSKENEEEPTLQSVQSPGI